MKEVERFARELNNVELFAVPKARLGLINAARLAFWPDLEYLRSFLVATRL